MPATLTIAITSFWILDLALSIIQPAVIALLTDRASAEQQKAGNGFTASNNIMHVNNECKFLTETAGFASLGSILAGVLAGKIPHVSFSVMVILPFMGNEFRAMATVGSVILTICSVLCFIFVKEQSTEHLTLKKTTFIRTLKVQFNRDISSKRRY